MQNKCFIQRYQKKLNSLYHKYDNIDIGDTPMETKNLFHSTWTTDPKEILMKGFDKNFSSEDNFLGAGIYLAENLDYSHFNSDGKFVHWVNPQDKNCNEFKAILIKSVTGVSQRIRPIKYQQENAKSEEALQLVGKDLTLLEINNE